MSAVRISVGLSLAFFSICFAATSQEKEITVTGNLSRVMAIGGESTGWTINLDSGTSIDGKQIDSIEVASRKIKRLEALANKRVRATGKIEHRQGVETGDRIILNISSIKEVNSNAASPYKRPLPRRLLSTSQAAALEELPGTKMIGKVHPTLAFPEAGKFRAAAPATASLAQPRSAGITSTWAPSVRLEWHASRR